jgi:hypothetical protein
MTERKTTMAEKRSVANKPADRSERFKTVSILLGK